MTDFARLLIDQIPSLRRYARALLGDAAEVDDLVQACLERAWSRSHLFRADEDIRVWLFTILHNLYVSAVRRQRRRPTLVSLRDATERVSAAPLQEARMEIADLDRALEELPAEQRAAVLLVALEDLSYKQAATVLGIPPGTLMSRLARGRKHLRSALEGRIAIDLKRVQ